MCNNVSSIHELMDPFKEIYPMIRFDRFFQSVINTNLYWIQIIILENRIYFLKFITN